MKAAKFRTTMGVAIALPLLFACATEGDTKTAANQRTEPCPTNRTYVCEERIGQVQSCKCVHKDDMRDVFDLRGDRH